MFDSNHITVNDKNHLTIGGCDALELAQEFGTPLYCLSEDVIRENCRFYADSMLKHYCGESMVLYAGKALCTGALLKIIDEEGLGLDVVSGGELYTAKHAGFPMENVYFHGNNKTDEELSMALSFGVGRFVVDNTYELVRLNQIAAQMDKTASVILRMTPGVEAHTHEFIRTGQIDSKFGIIMDSEEANEAAEMAAELQHIDLCGLHCHIGSQIFDTEPYYEAAKRMMSFVSDIYHLYDITITELNLGGGFGIPYTADDDKADYDKFCRKISHTVSNAANVMNLPLPKLLIEPGRSIVGPAGVTLYTVGAVKEIPNIRTYVAVDGGMADNPRYCLYGAKYSFLNAASAKDKPTMCATIAGRCCESGDLLGEHIMVQPLMPRDILAVLTTGAYNYSMASNYNRLPKPAMVMTKNGKARLIVKRESYEDIVRNDIIE